MATQQQHQAQSVLQAHALCICCSGNTTVSQTLDISATSAKGEAFQAGRTLVVSRSATETPLC